MLSIRRYQNHNFAPKSDGFSAQIDGFLRFFVVLMLQIEFRYDFKQFLIDFVVQNALKSILKFLILVTSAPHGALSWLDCLTYLFQLRRNLRHPDRKMLSDCSWGRHGVSGVRRWALRSLQEPSESTEYVCLEHWNHRNCLREQDPVTRILRGTWSGKTPKKIWQKTSALVLCQFSRVLFRIEYSQS